VSLCVTNNYELTKLVPRSGRDHEIPLSIFETASWDKNTGDNNIPFSLNILIFMDNEKPRSHYLMSIINEK
jgi:hypothetical protein